MPLDPQETYLELLGKIDLSPLPEPALRFLWDYLTYSSATDKVSNLLDEMRRLYDANYNLGDYRERIEYKE